MGNEITKRRLAAVLIADAAGYSRLMGLDEVGTHQQMLVDRREVIDKQIDQFDGRIVHTAGDGVLVEFASVVSAVECATQMQREFARRKADIADEHRMNWRIGINFGDVIVEDDDIYGDSVNIAARLESLAEPGGICIAGRVYNEVRSKLNVGFEHLGEKWLKNIVEPVHVYRSTVGLEPPDTSARESRSRPNMVVDRPSIAVMPFINLTPNPDNQYLVDGLTEDLITDLSMSPEFFVISRSSSFVFQGGGQDLSNIASQLGVRYLITGSVQRDESNFRVTCHLVEASSGEQIWTGRYNRDNANLFKVRDEITRSIAATLMTTSGEIAKAELKRQSERPPESFGIYDHYLKGRHYFHRSILPPWDVGKNWSDLAKNEYCKGIALSDPPYWPLYAGLAWQHAIDFDWSYSEDSDKSLQMAFDNASIAVKNAPENHQAHWIMGWSYLYYKRDHDRAMFHYEKARQLNVGDSRMLADFGQCLIYAGQLEQALLSLRQAIRVNPLHEQWYDEFLAWAHEENDEPELAIELLSKFDELEGIWSHVIWARSYAQTGQLDEFKKQIEILDRMALEQNGENFTPSFYRKFVAKNDPYKDPVRAQRAIRIMQEAYQKCYAEAESTEVS